MAAEKKNNARRRDVTVLVARPAIVRTAIDLEFLAEHRPKFTIKDLLVFAMALGGRLHQRHYDRDGNLLSSVSIEFEIPVTEEVPLRKRSLRR